MGCEFVDCRVDRDSEEKPGYGTHQAARVVGSALSTAAGSTVAGARHERGVGAALLDRMAVSISTLDDMVVAWGDRSVVRIPPSLACRASKAVLAGSSMATLGATVGVAALEGRRMAVATLTAGSGGRRVNGTPNV